MTTVCSRGRNFLLFTRPRHLEICQPLYQQQKNSFHLDSDVLDDKQTLLKNTANSLFKVGYLRLASDKTSENVYEHFAEPTNTQWEFKPVWPTNNFHKSWGMEKIRKSFFFQKKIYIRVCHGTKHIF